MWPVAPKTSHTFGDGGLDGDGGSVVAGSVSLGSGVKWEVDGEQRRFDGDLVAWPTLDAGIVRGGGGLG